MSKRRPRRRGTRVCRQGRTGWEVPSQDGGLGLALTHMLGCVDFPVPRCVD